MNVKTNIIAAAATLAIFGMSAPAFAAWTTAGAPVNVAAQATALSKADVATTGGSTFTVTQGAAVGGVVNLGLAGGTFSVLATAAPTVTSSNAASTFALIGGGAGTAGASFQIVGAPVAIGDILTVNGFTVDVPAAAAAGAAVDQTIQVGAGLVESMGATLLSNAIDIVDALTGVVRPSTDTTDLATGFTTVNAGAVIGNQAVLDLTPGAATVVVATDGVLVNLTGNLAGVASISMTGMAASNVVGSTVAVPGTNIGTAGTLNINAGATAASGISTVDLAAGQTTVFTAAPTYDGVTALNNTTVAVSSSLFTPVGAVATLTPGVFLPNTPFINIIRQGGNVSVNRISAGSTLKISDMTGAGAGAAITYSAFDAAGAAIAPVAGAVPALPAALAANGTVVARTITATYPGVARLDVTVAASDVLVSHRQSTAKGTSVTTYRSSATAGAL